MFRDTKLFRETTDGVENLPSSRNEHRPPNPPSSGLPRDPLHAIPDPTQTWTPGLDKKSVLGSRVETTPTKPKGVRAADALPHFRTPEKQGNGTFGKNRFGWSATEPRNEMATYIGPSSRNGGSLNMTPRTGRGTETTPTKSVNKPPNAGFAPLSSSRVPGSHSRSVSYAALSRGVPACNGQLPTVINTVEVPHFDLKEDPSFWIHHNVQVIIRVRPLSCSERGQHGYNRCVKQETSQNITWIGQPETRFTFDHVACETVDQEMLFRKAGLPMVENCLSGYNSCMFAYGQTGSGKTYTMLGDLDELEFKPSPHRGMTPRIFEYLFARIRAEEESRRDDQLKYSCRCSFLEIYNEQITDLLNPSAANLFLREDIQNGIYVENLSEFEVYSVGDILNLLSQGSLNRKVAATNMNLESSRSHSVFTCVIESKWERDSTTNSRFARLNLVDLAGSERQKTSGAEGERLKEAANINKSLSTLGHVIMVLVEVANGKIRHVPYRDSKLTFLLQDSLGGNSKTIIIANISPSTSCAAESLNTLKFAQRAKLIQNNAIVNEDSSGDVSALQHQIRALKEEVSALKKRQPVSRSLSFGPLTLQYNSEDSGCVDMEIDQPMPDNFEQLKSLDKMVAGALRREQMAESSIKKLEAEIEHLNHLVHQREEDARCSKMKLKFREDKIRRMESLLNGVKPVESYLLEENDALSKEIRMLQEKGDRNPEVTRFALENIRLLEQVKRFQNFYEEGEREALLSEVSELRDKLIQLFDEDTKHDVHSSMPIALEESTKSIKESDSIHVEGPAVEELLNLELELDIIKIILKEERSARAKADELATCLSRELKLAEEGTLSTSKQYEDVNEQLKEAKSTLEFLESQLHKQELEFVTFKQRTLHLESNDYSVSEGGKREDSLLQFRLEKMQASLDKAKMLNAMYQRDHAFQKANSEEMDETRQQVEEETAQVIVCLQEELSALQQQVQDSCWKEKEAESSRALLEATLLEQQDACSALSCENEALRQKMKEKENYLELLLKEWELMSNEIEVALTGGHEALVDASEQLDFICSYVPLKGRCISEQVHRLIKQASEKDIIIEDLNLCLESANATLKDMECMLQTLKGATLAITESHQKECSEKEKEIQRLRCELNVTSKSNMDMESDISVACDELRNASKSATVAFVIVKRLSELNDAHLDALNHIEVQLKESTELDHMKDGLLDKCAVVSEETDRQIQSLRKELELAEESGSYLRDELAKKHAYISVMEMQLEEYCELDILKTKQKLSELQKGVFTMKSCMITYEDVDGSRDAWLAEGRKVYHVYNNSDGCPTDDESGSTFEVSSDLSVYEDVKQNEKSTKACKSGFNKDATVGLLRKEIESALESLKEVQAELARLNAEKQELYMSDRRSREGMVMLKNQVCHIQGALGDFEDQFLDKVKALSQKLDQVEQHVEEATYSWSQAKETFDDELSNATIDVVKKTAEASCLFSKYEEAQDVMKEADDMIKGLMIANETMKLEIKDLTEKNMKSVGELEAFNILKEKLLADIERSFDCITRKENEAEEFSAKLRTFESKLTDLQQQEELMLEMSNCHEFEIANLVKELNHSHSDVFSSLLEKESLLNDSKEASASKEENLMMELSAKDLELVIMTSELQQLSDEKAEMESKQFYSCTALEQLKEEFITMSFSSNVMQQLLLQSHVMKINAMEKENLSLMKQLRILQLGEFEDLSLISSSAAKCLNLTEAAEIESHRMFAMLNEKIEIISGRLSQDNCEHLEVVAKIEEMLEPLETLAEDAISENSSLKLELLRKDEVLNGLLFDLSFLQESASSCKDQKDEIEELRASLNLKEVELKTRSLELDENVAHVHELEALVQEMVDKMSLLERDLSAATSSVELLVNEKADLTSHIDEILSAKVSLERELTDKRKLVESLEIGITNMQYSIDQTNASIESLKSELEEVRIDRDHLQQEQCDLEEKLDTAQALAEEYEAIAMEAKQIAESNRVYGEEKEEEVKLLEISIRELDRTVDAMENKVDILREEAERQRLQREDLEVELDSLKQKMHDLKTAESDIKSHMEEKEQTLLKALNHVQKLEKDLADKDVQISNCKAHITELNLHAEAQASEYKKKFKALEAMGEQVKTEGPSSRGKSCSSNKLEKNATKPRGSGSPFKCMGIGLVQQLKLEKDEDLTAERLRIQELEALAANRQKEIFVLNNRLAAAESMTHDVIRDLLGVKQDMTSYVSMLDKQQVQKIAESVQVDNVGPGVTFEDMYKLKKLLSEFVEERKGWLEEIEKRHTELLAAQLELEKLHQRDRSVTAENEVLKVDVEKYKNKVVELEGEVDKLSGQQNLHQRIHHHAKIKEENNLLKRQNEEISARLMGAESLLKRIKGGLPGVRAYDGKVQYMDFDAEKRLSKKLKEAEAEKVQLAQELLGLCTSILKAAGIKKASSEDINVASAEEALEQLRSRFTCLEREYENFKLKSRIENERIRLSEIIEQSPRADGNWMTPPKRASASPFFSALDR